jgi:hypothetical protein
MEPTPQQLKSFYRVAVRISNLLQPINLVRYDERVQRVVILVGETLQIEILPNGEVLNLVYFENCSFKAKIVGLLPYVAMTKLHFSSWTRFN